MYFETLEDINRIWKPDLYGEVLSISSVYFKNANGLKIPLDHVYCAAIDTDQGILLMPTRSNGTEPGIILKIKLGCEFADVGLYTLLNSSEHKLEGWGEGTAYLQINP